MWQPVILSVTVATAGTALATVLGLAAATWLCDRKGQGALLVEVALTAPMVLPPTVLGYYLLVVLGRGSPIDALWHSLFGDGLVFSRSGAVVAATLGALPLVIRAARSALRQVPAQLLAAAATLGAGPWQQWWRVRLPLALPGVLAGVSLGFARALGDFGVTLMVAGNIAGHTQTAPLAIYDALQAGHAADANAMAIVLTAVAIVLLWAVRLLEQRRQPDA